LILRSLGLVVLAYLLGSLSPSLYLGKLLRGVDLRRHGSGNLGTTNAFRILGKPIGAAVLLADLLKGFLPVLLARLVAGPWVTVLVALAAIAGHNYSFLLRGKGGKGVATGAGTVLAMLPLLLLIQVSVWGVVFLVSGYVSVGSLGATLLLPVLVIATGQPVAYLVFSLAGSLVVLWAHRTNIARLARGTESRVTFPWHRRKGGSCDPGDPAPASGTREARDG
jgi:glycerol-3-phosphate acyltransferase PlsY